jgi:hypothetical protein
MAVVLLRELSVAGAFLVAEASSETAVSANLRRYATNEPRRCHIMAVRTATM